MYSAEEKIIEDLEEEVEALYDFILKRTGYTYKEVQDWLRLPKGFGDR